MFAPLAQLVRAQSLYLWGPWFESKRAHLVIINLIKNIWTKKK